jgi:ABC-type glycerol-3-phosphate transport system substrate-binding protein
MSSGPENRSTSFTRRRFLQVAGAAAAGLVLGSCAPAVKKSATTQGQPVQLVYQDWRTEWFPPMAAAMLDEFHATHPNIRVFYVPDPENERFAEKMLADMQAGTAPDVFQGNGVFFPTWAQKGYTLDLRPFAEADLDQATISDWDLLQQGHVQRAWHRLPVGLVEPGRLSGSNATTDAREDGSDR